MTLATTVDAEAAAIVKAAMKTPRKKYARQVHKRCIYCTIVVGEGVPIKDELEYEAFIETDTGPVCSKCVADPLAAQRGRRDAERITRRTTVRAGIPLRRDGNRKRSQDPVKIERNEHIWRMSQNGLNYQKIAEQVGLTRSGVGGVVRMMRMRKEVHGE